MAGSEEWVRWWVVIQAFRVETWYGMVVDTGMGNEGILERGSGRARGFGGKRRKM